MSLKEKKYSHAGFIVVSDEGLCVYHFIDKEHSKGVTIDKLEDFISEQQCSSYAVYHPSYSEKQKQGIKAFIKDPLNNNKTFDTDFNLQTDDKLYCTEWIYKVLKQNGFNIPVTISNDIEYIAPDNLYINDFTKRVSYESYQPQ